MAAVMFGEHTLLDNGKEGSDADISFFGSCLTLRPKVLQGHSGP
jgi:hypothetical protein